MLTAHSSRSQSRHCDPAHQAGRRRLYRCSSHRGGIGAGAACWAAICCRCSLQQPTVDFLIDSSPSVEGGMADGSDSACCVARCIGASRHDTRRNASKE
jgi:hypothetical protein